MDKNYEFVDSIDSLSEPSELEYSGSGWQPSGAEHEENIAENELEDQGPIVDATADDPGPNKNRKRIRNENKKGQIKRFRNSGRANRDKEPMKYGCEDHWTWNRHDRSHEVRLYGSGLRVAHFHPNWSSGTAGVRGTRILNNGRYYWEVQVSQRIFGTSMMFGIGTKKARLHRNLFTNMIGEDEHSWGLSHKGLIWHGGVWAQYTAPFRENQATTVGVLFDGVEGTLTFYKDNKCLGVAFRDLQQVRQPLYPMVCSTACKTEMTLTYMRRDFVNLQDRCRAVILEGIKNKRDLEKLEVPTLIRNYLSEAISRQYVPVNYYVLNV